MNRRPTVSGPGATPGQVSITAGLAKVLEAAEREAKRLTNEYISVEHLVIALAEQGTSSAAGRILASHNATRVTSATTEGAYEALEKYGRDLVAEARAGKLTARGDVPEGLRDRTIFARGMGSLVTGATCTNCGKRNRVPAGAQGKPRCALCHQWLPWIAASGDEDFTEIVESASVPVLVDMWATWCGTCRMVSPALEQLATERAGQLKLVKVDVDNAPAIAHQFAVQKVPTVLVLNDHEVLGRQSGAAPIAALRNWLGEVLTETRKKKTR